MESAEIISGFADANEKFLSLITTYKNSQGTTTVTADELQSLLTQYQEIERALVKSPTRNNDTTTTQTDDISDEEFDGLLHEIDNESDMKSNQKLPDASADFISKPVSF